MTKQPENREVLGVKVVNARIKRVLAEIENQVVAERRFWLVTAYSETFLEAQDNPEFAQVLKKADWVVLDGVGGWAAMDYPTQGLKVAVNILQGKYNGRPVGVEIVRQLLEERKYKIFLLGGFGGVARRLAEKYGCGWDEGDKNVQYSMVNSQSIIKINEFKPDILLVAYGRVKQEKWIAQNLDRLNCKVVMGVGSSFDEIMGEGVWARKTPAWTERAGVKWLWRLINDPGHLKRVWRAVIVFPWRVFRNG